MGFFTKDETKSLSRGKGGKALTCARCGLHKECKTPRMGVQGKGRKKILLIGDIVSKQDDRKGAFWTDKAGKLLTKELMNRNISLNRDCSSIMAINCRAPKKTEIEDYMVECCRRRVWKVIEEQSPHLIIALGANALRSLYSHRTNESLGITKWRGFAIPDRDINAWVVPTLDPLQIVNQEKYAEVKRVWQLDLDLAISKLKEEVPSFPPEKDGVERLSEKEALSRLREIDTDFAFDYESTGLKPHAPGHRIVCCSVSPDPDTSLVFMWTEEIRRVMKRLLQDPKLGKMAHNMKFEHQWSRIRAKANVNNWKWDSLLAAHVLDNRRGVAGLKFQSIVNFGLLNYNEEVDDYLKGVDPKDGNSLNRIETLIKTRSGRQDLLTYCGIDSLVQHRLALKQMEVVNVGT